MAVAQTLITEPSTASSKAVVVRPFTGTDLEAWESVVHRSSSGTFLHSRRFLRYHENRFRDWSLVFMRDGGRMVGVMPAALDPMDEDTLVSHPGATYGGIVHDGTLNGQHMEDAMRAVIELLRLHGRKRLIYRAVPYLYHQTPAQDDLYWLHRLGAVRFRCDLSATIDVRHRRPLSVTRRRNFRKASCAGLQVSDSAANLPRFWPLLESVLQQRHRVRPVHTIDEIEGLAHRLPGCIRCITAEEQGEVIAGSVLFITDSVVHAQYYAAGPRGRQLSALDLIIEYSIDLTQQLQCRYYDMGASTPNRGRELNEGLARYKASFGAGSTVYEHYELCL